MRTLLARVLRRRDRVGMARPRRGAAAAEFALTLPVMVLLLLGTIEYGNYFSQLAMVNTAVQDAARFGSNQSNTLLAQTQAGAAARTLLNDLGFDCDDLAACGIRPTLFAEDGLIYIELTVNVPYDQVTNAIPKMGEYGTVALPTTMRARAVFPIVNPVLVGGP